MRVERPLPDAPRGKGEREGGKRQQGWERRANKPDFCSHGSLKTGLGESGASHVATGARAHARHLFVDGDVF